MPVDWFDEQGSGNPYDDPGYTPPEGNIWTNPPPPPPSTYTPDPFQYGTPAAPQTLDDPSPNTPPQTPPTTLPGNGASSQNPYQFVRDWQQRYGYSAQSLQEMVRAAQSAGLAIRFADHNGRPSLDKIWMPDGRMFDIVRGVDGPDPGWAFQDVTAAHYGAEGQGGNNGPYTPFSFPQYSAPAPFSIGGYSAPAPYQAPAPFTYDPFKAPPAFEAPTMEQAVNDPGYQFRLKEGQQALERSASARGTLLTSGTLKDLVNYGQEAASQQYQDVYQQELGEYAMNYENLFGAYNANLGAAQTAYGLNATTGLNAYQTNASTSLAAYLANANTALSAYQTNLGSSQFGYNANFQNAFQANNVANNNTNSYASNLYDLASLGQNATGYGRGK